MIFRRAQNSDLNRIMQIIGQAQAQMKALGSQQWQNGYPAENDILRDLAHGWGYLLDTSDTIAPKHHLNIDTLDMGFQRPVFNIPTMIQKSPIADYSSAQKADPIIAYGALLFDGEAAYDRLDGKWLTGGSYLVLHRLAVADEAKRQGVATQFILHCTHLAIEHNVRSFRIDTNYDNQYMLRMLDRLGFVYCGKVRYPSGERLAFEKML